MIKNEEYVISNIIFLTQKIYANLLEMEEKCKDEEPKEKLKGARKDLLKILFYFLSLI